MKTFAVLLLICAVALVSVSNAQNSDERATQLASDVAKRFIGAIDRKRADVAERLAFVEKRELPSGATRRFPLVSEGVLNVTIEAREKFGKLLSRSLVQTSVVKEHYRLPDSKFVEFHYELRFQKKEKVSEVIKIKVEGDQAGKVVFFASR